MSLPRSAMQVPTGAEPVNDNVPGTITPDEAPFFAALGLVCPGVVVLTAYVLMSGPDNVMALAKH